MKNYNNLFIISNLPKPLKKDELFDCLKRSKEGDLEARNKAITHNVKLVLNQMMKKFSNSPYDQQELVSIGLIGLVKAVDTFDIEKGFNFATYAIRCIDNEILMFIRKAKNILKEESFDDVIITDKDGNDLTVENILVDENTSITEDYENKELIQEIKKQVDNLHGREKEVVKLYFGFYNDKQYNQSEIGFMMGLTRSYISRIICNALRNIKSQLIQRKFLNSTFSLEKLSSGSRQWKDGSITLEEMKTIYYYFSDYQKSEIKQAIEQLNDNEIKFVKLVYGETLDDGITSSSLNTKQSDEFFGNIMPKIREILINMKTGKKGDQQQIAKEGKKKMSQNLKSIYKYFKDYSKEKIDEMLLKLTDSERALIKLRYGDDLENPVTDASWDDQHNKWFYGSLVPKMRRLLSNPTGKRKPREAQKKVNNEPNIQNENIVITTPSICLTEDKITKDVYIQMLELLRTPIFSNLLKRLDPKEAVIISLKLGYIDGKYFSNEAISNFLEIDSKEITEIVTRALSSYKQMLNIIIDETISITADDSKNPYTLKN